MYKSKRNYNNKAPVTLKTNVMMKRKYFDFRISEQWVKSRLTGFFETNLWIY